MSQGDAEGREAALPLGFLIALAGQYAADGFRATIEPLGVTPRHFAILWALTREDGQTQQTLADSLRIPASRVVALIDRLAELGAVERHPSPTDRRVRHVMITEEGRLLASELQALAKTFEERLLVDLSIEEQQTMRAMLVRLGMAQGAWLDRG